MIKNAPFHELEQALVIWIHIVGEKRNVLNRPMVQEKAIEFAKVLNLTDFTSKNGKISTSRQ